MFYEVPLIGKMIDVFFLSSLEPGFVNVRVKLHGFLCQLRAGSLPSEALYAKYSIVITCNYNESLDLTNSAN